MTIKVTNGPAKLVPQSQPSSTVESIVNQNGRKEPITIRPIITRRLLPSSTMATVIGNSTTSSTSALNVATARNASVIVLNQAQFAQLIAQGKKFTVVTPANPRTTAATTTTPAVFTIKAATDSAKPTVAAVPLSSVQVPQKTAGNKQLDQISNALDQLVLTK